MANIPTFAVKDKRAFGAKKESLTWIPTTYRNNNKFSDFWDLKKSNPYKSKIWFRENVE